MPVYKLLGGFRDKVPAYGSTMCGDDLPGGLSTPEEYACFAEKLVARGYKAIKLHTDAAGLLRAKSEDGCESLRRRARGGRTGY